MTLKALIFILLFTSSAVLAQQLPGQLPPADPGTDNFKWVYAAIIKPRCVSCHGAASENGSYATYADIKQNIESTDPTKTTFYGVLGDGTNCSMPESGKCIGTRGLRAAYWWIRKGALPQ